MKFRNILIVLFVAFGFSAFGQIDNFNLKVDGIGCPFCAYGLDKKFKKVEGLKKFGIDMEEGLVSFEVPSKEMLTANAVIKIVDDAGYTPVSYKIIRGDGSIQEGKADVAIVKDLPQGELLEASFTVAGKCTMCKKRIENAALSLDQVYRANWSEEEQMLHIQYQGEDDAMAVSRAVAQAGHDTKAVRAKKRTYRKLPGCCKYKRIKK